MPTLYAYNPDGSPVQRHGMCPVACPPKRDEGRQLRSLARLAWSCRKGIYREPPEGAAVRYEGETDDTFRFERVPVIEANEVVRTELRWVDLRERRRAEREAAALVAARKALAAELAERARAEQAEESA